MQNKDIITVTSPLMPDLEEFHELLKDIWDRRWITNNGHYHQLLEKALAEYLKVPYVSLFTNGTLPLITALQALRIRRGHHHPLLFRSHHPCTLVEWHQTCIRGY